jgi:anti-sigma28 factor (negative regulator of flagellin synthesis)
MDVNTRMNAQVKNYEPASNTGKTGKTGKHEAFMPQTYAPKAKKEEAGPEDSLEISEAALNSEKTKGKKGNWDKFDMDAFRGEIRNTLMKSIMESKDALLKSGVEFAKYNEDSLLYDLSSLNSGKGVEAAKVPEYWNADNTSQRIVDFAMSFRSLAPELSDEEYINKIRDAVEKGYGQAKKSLGDLPGPSAKLFNDTYTTTMKKFDELLEKARKGSDE